MSALKGVMMLTNEFPPIVSGGAEQQAEQLAITLSRRGLAVSVITRGAPGLPRHQHREGLWIERIPQHGPGKLKTVTFVLGAVGSLWRRRKDYTVLHAHLAFAPALAAVLIGRLIRKRIIVKFGNSGPYGDIGTSQRTWRGRLRLMLIRRWADVCIALDAAMEAELLAAGFERARVRRMVNGVDAEAFRPASQRTAAKQRLGWADHIVALYVGRLTAQKALPDLLCAFHQARATCPSLRLVLVGDGPEREALQDQARTLGLDGQVTFAGVQHTIGDYLAAADIFVLPSASEGISNALLEAMAAGLPCLATAVGGTPEVLAEGACGVLVPPHQPDQLGLALSRLASQPGERQRLGEAARKRIETRYAFTIVSEQYLTLYRQLAERSGT